MAGKLGVALTEALVGGRWLAEGDGGHGRPRYNQGMSDEGFRVERRRGGDRRSEFGERPEDRILYLPMIFDFDPLPKDRRVAPQKAPGRPPEHPCRPGGQGP